MGSAFKVSGVDVSYGGSNMRILYCGGTFNLEFYQV